MRHSILTLALLTSAALAAPLPFSSSSANRSLFEAKDAAHAKATVARFSADVFHDRVMLALVPQDLAALRGRTQAEQRRWLKAKLVVERPRETWVRVVITGTDTQETRAVRDALTAVLTGLLTPRDQAMLEARRATLDLRSVQVQLLVAGRRGRGMPPPVIVNEKNFTAGAEPQQIQAERNAVPLKKVN